VKKTVQNSNFFCFYAIFVVAVSICGW